MDVQAVDKEIQVKGMVITLQQYLHSKKHGPGYGENNKHNCRELFGKVSINQFYRPTFSLEYPVLF